MTVSPQDPTAAFWPTSMQELEDAERFLVWSFRRWALGLARNDGGQWSLVWNGFARRFGSRDGRAALGGLATLMGALGEHARRAVRHHQPCCPCLGADEAWLVSFVGACQRGERSRARLLAEWMVAGAGVGDLLAAGLRLAAALDAHAMALPARGRDGRPAGGGARPVLH
jgi:hypothetical protein